MKVTINNEFTTINREAYAKQLAKQLAKLNPEELIKQSVLPYTKLLTASGEVWSDACGDFLSLDVFCKNHLEVYSAGLIFKVEDIDELTLNSAHIYSIYSYDSARTGAEMDVNFTTDNY